MKEKDMSEKPEDEILRLVRLIAKSKSKLFGNFDVFHGSRILLISFAAIYVVYAFAAVFEKASVFDNLTVGLTLTAVVLASFTILAQFAEETIADVNFKRMVKLCSDEGKKLEENEKPLLKALIKIKVKHREFDLEQIYNMNPSMFTREKLLEKLYE